MNIQSLYAMSIEPSRFVTTAARKANKVSEDEEPSMDDVGDRVVISSKAHAALNEMRHTPGIDLGLKALLGSSPLTEEKAAKVLDRINQGFYKQPEVLREIATLLTEALEAEVP